MATIRPFQAIRPRREYASQVVSLPYDVMNKEEAKQMAADNPYSFLHISRSEIDLPEGCDPYSPLVYAKAKQNIDSFLSNEILEKDAVPMLYLYRQAMNGRTQTGIVACVCVDEYQNGIIKKHEHTRVEKEIDRIRHFSVCNANTEPVFLTHRRRSSLDRITAGWMQAHEAEYDFTDAAQIGHTLWKIDDPAVIDALIAEFGQIPALYIADGHHRSASAVKVGIRRRSQNPHYTGEEEFNFFMAVIFPDEDLKIFDYNRVVKDLNGLTVDEFLTKLRENFQVEKMGAEPYAPEEPHIFSLYLDNVWYKLTARKSILSADRIAGLDVSILQDHVLQPLLDIHDPRTDKRIDFVGGIRGLSELKRRCHLDMQAAFALYPVSITELLAVADENKIMPPKSTWFEPKLGSGLFMHQL